MPFTGKIALVTGASSGIGREIALAFARQGAKVVVNGRDHDRVEAVAADIRDLGREAVGIPADVTVKAQVTALVAGTVSAFGRIDVLVNNAGGSSGARTVADLAEEDWDGVIATNLKSVFLVSQAVLPILKDQRSGKIVNISSQAGRALTVLAGPHYSAAKAGVQAFTRQLAREAAPFGINVNAVAPGIIRSGPRLGAIWDTFPPERQARFLEDIPAGRLGDNADIASAVLFLASDGGAYLIGATLDVNGGRWML